jgi:hypothetical protein
MSVISLMGHALDQELQRRGIFSIGRKDCDEIIAVVIQRTAKLEPPIRAQTAREPDQRS